jgi:hypothetical protein
MRHQDADLHLAALEGLLDETIGLLERYGGDQWAVWLRTSRRRLAAGDAYGLDHLLRAFGGMGSFNDLALMRVNGHRIDPAQEGDVNDLLVRLRSDIWTEAMALRQALRSSW